MNYQTMLAKVGQTELLKGNSYWPDSPYRFDENVVKAIIAAHAAQMPLLVRGEVGTGKSTLALAAAHLLERELLVEVVRPNTEAEELLWNFDFTGRLAEANQIKHDYSAALRQSKFLSPGVFWHALDPIGARAQQKIAKPDCMPLIDAERAASNGTVLLIDEIDKSDTNYLANGLLEVIANHQFSCPHHEHPIALSEERPPPFVVFTTNDLRELSPAFVRRCIVLTLEMPGDFTTYLERIGRAHFNTNEVPDTILNRAAQLIESDRNEEHMMQYKSGPAEYLAMLRCYASLDVPASEKLGLFEDLTQFFLKSAAFQRASL